ncbi:inositol monophosphatase family protein [Corynebacterium kroppenstedtii]|uniref:inositol monophosphatase family protein n=1 Tax=Corynebacterium sp. PCR 32 TaxID=3351342 RepID=UPI00309A21E9
MTSVSPYNQYSSADESALANPNVSNPSTLTDEANSELNIALSVAMAAGRHVREERERRAGTLAPIGTKSSDNDPVTEVDKSTESLVRRLISTVRPNDAIVGEESGGDLPEEGTVWVVDPIDGTVNFLYGIPCYSVSLAAQVNGETVAAVVVDVAHDATYFASRGVGSFLRHGALRHDITEPRAVGSDIRLSVARGCDLSNALVSTGFGYTASRRHIQGTVVSAMLETVRDIRRMGSAALDLCHVAAGRVDAHYEHGLNLWDYAAGALIAREAGVRVDTPARTSSGREGELLIAAHPDLFGPLREGLARAGGLEPIPAE